jgi:hypothetical protein
MRHRQTTGAGSSGARPSIVVLILTAAGGGLAAGLGQPAGPWAGYGVASAAALVGCGTLWQQRGLLERRAKETARRLRTELDAAAAAQQRHGAETERARAELEHEQQYSLLIQDQLTRAREQLERERAARRDAERELDALTGAGGWQSGASSMLTSSALLTVEEPRASAQPAAILPVGPDRIPARPAAPAPTGLSAARRRGWQVVDGEDADGEDELAAAEADRLYRPFIDQLSAAAVPVSDAALAMAPVIGAADLDGVLDLTAYDETVEFSIRELKGMA